MEPINKTLNDIIDNNIKEISTLMQKICKNINELKNNQTNLDNDDIRIYFLINISSFSFDTIIAYKLSKSLNSRTWWINNIQDSNETYFPQDDEIVSRIKLFHKNIELNLINLSFSLTEDAFRQLIRHVKPGSCKGGTAPFKRIYEILLQELNLTYDNSLFELFRIVRNGFHNNGFYYPVNKTNNYSIEYRNKIYSFHYAKKILYPEGLPILPILEDVTNLYFEMANSENLKNFSIIKQANID